MKNFIRFVFCAALAVASLGGQTIYPTVQRGKATALADTRVPFSDSSGRLTDDADLTFATDTLTATKIVGSTSITDSGLTATRVTFAGTAGLLSDDADLTFATDTLTFTKGLTPTSLMIGNGTAANLLSALTVYDTGSSLPRGISNVQVSSGVDSANFSGYKARGTPGSLTTIVTGDLLANIRAWGYDGSNYINAGSFRWTSEGTIAATRVPSKAEILVSTDAAPSVLTTSASFSGKDGIALTAVGTNQSITMTPSGTGSLKGNWASSSAVAFALNNAGSGELDFNLIRSGGAGTNSSWSVYLPASSTQLRFFSGSDLLVMTAGGNLLVGGLTAEGVGRLQFPAAANSAGGITFGTDTNFYRTTATKVTLTSSLAITATNGFVSLGDGLSFMQYDGSNGLVFGTGSGTTAFALTSAQNATFAKLITSYNGIATAGNGVVTVQGAGRSTAQTAAVASVATYTVGAADASFVVSANVNVTTSGSEAFTSTVAYTDETNTARTLTLNFTILAGTISPNIAFTNGAVPYEGLPTHIRCKASTSITVKTAAGGTYTGCTYNVEGVITKLQ